jgi:hypothetical protein
MMTIEGEERKVAIRTRLIRARSDFHQLLDSLSEDDLKRQSKNEGWKNREILFHMVFGFQLILVLGPMLRFWSRLPDRYSKMFANALNFSTGPFNWINGMAPRVGGRIFTGRRLRRRFESIHRSLIRLVDSIDEHELDAGMHYPDKWDPLFDDYMTLEKLFSYPIRHFEFHVGQLSR